jgi:hypothetical protein
MLLRQITLCALLLPLIVSCGTTPSPDSLPTPNLQNLQTQVKCPPVPDFGPDPAAPVFEDSDSYPTFLVKVWDFTSMTITLDRQKQKWRSEHPNCP